MKSLWPEDELNHYHEPSEIAEETKSELGFTSSIELERKT